MSSVSVVVDIDLDSKLEVLPLIRLSGELGVCWHVLLVQFLEIS